MESRINLIKTLTIDGPLVLAPLGGGPGTPSLAAAVCNAGALGSLGAAYLSAEELEKDILKMRQMTKRSFAVNLFAPSSVPVISSAQTAEALRATKIYRDELGLSAPVIKTSPFEDFDKQMAIIFKHKPAVFSFVFGLIESDYVKECRKLGILVVGTATNLEEALALEGLGVDAIVLQGSEAGGHRGMFLPEQTDSDLKIEPLTRLVAENIRLPLIASGGLMTGKDIARALSWGAQAAQLGTAFLLCPEAGTSEPYRQELRAHRTRPRLTRVYSGRIARGLENRFMSEMEAQSQAILPWPTQNAFTRDIRQKSAQQGSSEFLSLWAGEHVAGIRELPAATLVKTLFAEIT